MKDKTWKLIDCLFWTVLLIANIICFCFNVFENSEVRYILMNGFAAILCQINLQESERKYYDRQ